MKVTNWRRKLAASLAACGLLSPAAALAAELNTNLVLDPSFENVNTADIGPFASSRLLQWNDAGVDGVADDDNFAYAYTQNYAGVNTPAGAGATYFSGGFNTTAGQATIAQNVSVGTGATGALISGGEAAYSMSGFFSTYLTQNNASRLRVRFLDAGSNELGRGEVGGADFVNSLPIQDGRRDWGQDAATGLLPIGTSSLAVEVVSDTGETNYDGYTDLVDFRIVSAAESLLFVEVNTSTGNVVLKNQTGDVIHIDYYEIVSSGGNALSVANWNSLQDQNRAGFPSGNGSGNGWEEAGGSDAGVVGESYLLGNSGVDHQASISLGNLFNTSVQARDLTFRYGALAESSGAFDADFDADSDVDGTDFLIWQRNFARTGATKAQGDATGDGNVGAADFASWENDLGAGSGPTGTSRLFTSFVRYVSPATAASGVPEPTGALLVGAGLLACGVGTRRSRSLATRATTPDFT